MKRLLPVLLLMLALNSCMDLQVKLKLQSDWSGTANFDLVMLDQMYQMILMQTQQSGQGLFLPQGDEEKSRAALQSALEADGARLTDFENKVQDGIRTVHIGLEFKDVKKMIETKSAGDLLTLSRDGDNWKISLMDAATNLGFQGMGQEELEQTLTSVMPMMTGLKMKFEITVPEVVETNLKKSTAGTTAFALTFDEDIAGKSGKEAADAFKGLMAPKWIKFKGMK